MADNTINMPSGMGGLTRYFEEVQSRIQLKPMHVVIIIALFIAIELGTKFL